MWWAGRSALYPHPLCLGLLVQGPLARAWALPRFSAIEALRHRESSSVRSDGTQPWAPPVLVHGDSHQRACGRKTCVTVGKRHWRGVGI